MEARVLRIGNYVYSMEVYLDRVIALSEIAILCEFKSPIENVKPIPLTEEWLVKFGFSQTEESIKHFGDGSWGNGKLSLFFHEGFCEMKGAKLKYVHQLQNVFYALTGEELVLK